LISPAAQKRLQALGKSADRSQFTDWVQEVAASMNGLPTQIGNTGSKTPLSRIDQINDGRWAPELGYPDWRESENFESLKEYIAARLVDGDAGGLSPYLQALGGQIITGDLEPRGRKSGPKTSPQRTVALACVDALRAAGLPALVSEDWSPEGNDMTGCAIVADALEVSRNTLEKWWKNFRSHQKAWDG
jgi:hypothetical protein